MECATLHLGEEELKGELESLRVSRHPMTGAEDPEKLRSEAELLRSKLSEVEDFDKTRASIGYELAETKKELEKMRAAAAGASTQPHAASIRG